MRGRRWGWAGHRLESGARRKAPEKGFSEQRSGEVTPCGHLRDNLPGGGAGGAKAPGWDRAWHIGRTTERALVWDRVRDDWEGGGQRSGRPAGDQARSRWPLGRTRDHVPCTSWPFRQPLGSSTTLSVALRLCVFLLFLLFEAATSAAWPHWGV